MKRIYFHVRLLLISVMASFIFAACSAFQIRHIDDRGQTHTYVTDTVFVGTGTILDCVISPLHWVAGFFYFQSYIHAGDMTYPTFGASGCFAKAYGSGGVSGLIPVPSGFFSDRGNTTRVRFVDLNGNEMEIQGGVVEIRRVTRKIGFSLR